MSDLAPQFEPQAVDTLRHYCQSQSERTFKARGISLKRCPQCLLGLQTCICPWRYAIKSSLQFVLIMHRDEVYKPTNTGRLIADILPQQCHAFLWDRTNPSQQLLNIINDPARHCQLVFPPRGGDIRTRENQPATGDTGKIPTLILLDGTWKQARKMYSQAQWLKEVACLDLAQAMDSLDEQLGHYKVRKACETGRLATAEAAALCFHSALETDNAQHLLDYFSVFNEHYLATRANRCPAELPSHHALRASR